MADPSSQTLDEIIRELQRLIPLLESLGSTGVSNRAILDAFTKPGTSASRPVRSRDPENPARAPVFIEVLDGLDIEVVGVSSRALHAALHRPGAVRPYGKYGSELTIQVPKRGS